ncbi:hypothetical protein M0802_012637 [Mischocyttarus mexicanus]|nr:hypothetical protein M0802_012637 [Mischocyttarus mexicanus]
MYVPLKKQKKIVKDPECGLHKDVLFPKAKKLRHSAKKIKIKKSAKCEIANSLLANGGRVKGQNSGNVFS